MLLQNIMFCWACLALFAALVAVGGLLTRKGIDKDTGQTAKALFDFSAGQLEGRQMQKVLSDALSGGGTDAEFEQQTQTGQRCSARASAQSFSICAVSASSPSNFTSGRMCATKATSTVLP